MEKGTLYLVATPIGNLDDITKRALDTLSNVDLIAAEDTRKTLQLLNHFNIQKPLTSFYRHNEENKMMHLINLLNEGKNIAVVSDAGTPAISDPGEELVGECIKENIKIVPIPGAVALINGLIVSGIDCTRFCFEGFLPMNKRGRKERLAELINEKRTMIFYEAPHKLKYTLDDMYKYFGDRRMALVREITKIYEETLRMSLSNAIEYYKENNPKGEFVIVIEGKQIEQKEDIEIDKDHIKKLIDEITKKGISKKDAIGIVATDLGLPKKEVYNIAHKS